MHQGTEGEPVVSEEQLEAPELRKRTRKSRFDQPDERNEVTDPGEEFENNRQNEDRKRRHSPSPPVNE